MSDTQALNERMRQMFKQGNRWMMLPMWRLGLGPMINWTWRFNGRIMVLVHVGRKSGLRRYTPLNYHPQDGVTYATAGFGKGADWYRNIMAAGEAELWLPEGRFRVRVEEITGQAGSLDLLRAVLKDSGFAASLFGGMNPITISDADLAEKAAEYRMLRFSPLERISGPDGPGSWAWVWIPIGLITAALIAWAVVG